MSIMDKIVHLKVCFSLWLSIKSSDTQIKLRTRPTAMKDIAAGTGSGLLEEVHISQPFHSIRQAHTIYRS